MIIAPMKKLKDEDEINVNIFKLRLKHFYHNLLLYRVVRKSCLKCQSVIESVNDGDFIEMLRI